MKALLNSHFATAVFAAVGATTILGIHQGSAIAADLTYHFTITNLTGALAGQEFRGSVTIDDTHFQRSGFEYSGVSYTSNSHEFDGNVRFSFNFLDQTFTEADEELGRSYIYFQDGTPTHVFYDGGNYEHSYQGTGLIFQFWYPGGTDAAGQPLPRREFEYQTDWPLEWYGYGNVIFDPVNPVPEPSLIGGLGVLGAGWLLRWGRRAGAA
ncbi:PEP-CTERM sorting domain-containing protein [Geitlerinema sp. PCC 7407]|uniref:PEP-CTERM sorting domain-containing protein n=1 Tax=Geitlerinema sp. PCC 7407 TaxID=1173025 RepID=UPI00029FFFDF|nr:PEP-CTERM sorting domain-containing protein [Geitlerinema sp. PCC 7407]AFY67013.1 hypothetical protein GEI7407_2538 [Geitlerinema sp. PCC 7407]